MPQLRADNVQQMRNAALDKQIFLLFDETTLSGIKYLNILVGSLETTQVNCTTVNLYHVCQIATALLKQLTMQLDLLEYFLSFID